MRIAGSGATSRGTWSRSCCSAPSGSGMNFAIARWWGAAALGVFNLVTIAFFVFAVLGACGCSSRCCARSPSTPDDRDAASPRSSSARSCRTSCSPPSRRSFFVALRGPFAALLGSDAVAEGMLWAAPGLFCFAVNKVLFGVVNGLRRMRAFAVYTSLRYLLIAAGLVVARVARRRRRSPRR